MTILVLTGTVFMIVKLRDAPWEDILKLGASVAASEFWKWVQVAIDAYITNSLAVKLIR